MPALAVHEERQLALGDLVLAIALGVAEVELALYGRHPVVRERTVSISRWPPEVLVVVEVALGALALGPGVERVDEHRR
jgi:hypothetical protein